MGRGSWGHRSELIYPPAVSGPSGAPERVKGGKGGRRESPRDVQEGAKMAQERSKRAQDRTRAFQH
eukprot:9500243-Pyramimonas_sp.AAC.2